MRQIEKHMLLAIAKRKNWRGKNTEVRIADQSHGLIWKIDVLLHGNKIAALYPQSGTINLTLAGWNTVTTRSRLNAICTALKVRNGAWTQRSFAPHFGGIECSANDVFTCMTYSV